MKSQIIFSPAAGPRPISVVSMGVAGTIRRFGMRPVHTGALVACLTAIASTAHGQLRSDWVPFDARYTSYTTPNECRIATNRVRVSSANLPDFDTLSVRALAQWRPSREAKAELEQCMLRIHVDSLTRVALMPMATLYLAAGRDKDAETMVQRLLTGQWRRDTMDTLSVWDASYFDGANGSKRKAFVHSAAATAYLKAVPARLAAALSHLDSLERLEPDERLALVSQYFVVFVRARTLGDPTAVERSRQRIVSLGEKMLLNERQRAGPILFAAQQHAMAKVRFDSLAQSTAAYIRVQQSQLREFGIKDEALGMPMDTLKGDFSFPASAVFPVPGKINVIVVAGPTTFSPHAVFPMLRRLKQKHAGIEIVYASRTSGRFGPQLLEPKAEAEMQRKLAQDFMKMPFSMIVETTPSWRLPAPDRRLIHEKTPNLERYGGDLLLVDRRGTIVYHTTITKEPEDELDRLIAALRKQR